jgi:carbamoyl-phosphate synthase large subunit
MNILITSAGKRVSLVRAFKRELQIYFIKGKIFAADAIPELSAACIIADGWFQVPRLDDSSYIANLIDLCVKNHISVIIPTIDTELLLLAKNEKLLRSMGINPIISSFDFVKICRDKRKTHLFFKDNGIQVAEEYTKSNYTLPMFIKPTDGSRSVDNYIIKSKDDLTDYHFSNENLLFLEYLDLATHYEYTCDLYYNKVGQLKCVVPRLRIEVRDGEVNKGKTIKNSLVGFIKKKLAKIDGARGCLTVQFFMHHVSRAITGIEINPRFGGGYPLSYLAGANFPGWIIEEYLLGHEVGYYEDWEDNLLMLRYDEEVLVHDYKD